MTTRPPLTKATTRRIWFIKADAMIAIVFGLLLLLLILWSVGAHFANGWVWAGMALLGAISTASVFDDVRAIWRCTIELDPKDERV